jgi:hypothetical protein
MRSFLLFSSVCVAAAAITSPAAAASKYCLQGRDYGYPGNCQFPTYQSCMATASGTLNGCGINPAYAYGCNSRRPQPRQDYGWQ